jgi:hypothetical protein
MSLVLRGLMLNPVFIAFSASSILFFRAAAKAIK